MGCGRSRRARGVRWLVGGVAAAFVAAALPSVSGAADYCVAPNTSCDGPHNVSTLQEALKLAYTATDSDRVILGATTYMAPSVNGFGYINGNAPRPTPRLQHARRCTRYSTVGALKRTATQGANSIRFTGTIGSRTLRPGRYRHASAPPTRPATAPRHEPHGSAWPTADGGSPCTSASCVVTLRRMRNRSLMP